MQQQQRGVGNGEKDFPPSGRASEREVSQQQYSENSGAQGKTGAAIGENQERPEEQRSPG